MARVRGIKMSYITFLASDYPMQEVINPHIHFYSVNEALDKGIGLSSIVLDSTTIDRNRPDVIVWVVIHDARVTKQNETIAPL